MTYTTEIFPFFDDTDQEGIVFFGNYFRLAHRVIEEFVEHVEIGWQTWFRNPDWGVPLRHVEADYQAPMLPGKSYQVELAVLKMTTSTVQFQTLFKDNGKVCTTVKTTHVFVKRPQPEKMPIPPEVAEILKAYLV